MVSVSFLKLFPDPMEVCKVSPSIIERNKTMLTVGHSEPCPSPNGSLWVSFIQMGISYLIFTAMWVSPNILRYSIYPVFLTDSMKCSLHIDIVAYRAYEDVLLQCKNTGIIHMDNLGIQLWCVG